MSCCYLLLNILIYEKNSANGPKSERIFRIRASKTAKMFEKKRVAFQGVNVRSCT